MLLAKLGSVKLVNSVFNYLATRGLVHLTVAAAKAAASAAIFCFQAGVEKAVRAQTGLPSPALPSPLMVGIVFMLNFVAEGFFLGRAVKGELIADSAEAVFAGAAKNLQAITEGVEKYGAMKFGDALYNFLEEIPQEQKEEIIFVLLGKISDKFANGYRIGARTELGALLEIFESTSIASFAGAGQAYAAVKNL